MSCTQQEYSLAKEEGETVSYDAFVAAARTSGEALGCDVFLHMPFLMGGYPSPLLSWGNQTPSALQAGEGDYSQVECGRVS